MRNILLCDRNGSLTFCHHLTQGRRPYEVLLTHEVEIEVSQDQAIPPCVANGPEVCLTPQLSPLCRKVILCNDADRQKRLGLILL